MAIPKLIDPRITPTEERITTILQLCKDENFPEERKRKVLRDILGAHAAGALNLHTNIKQTSVNEADRRERLNELCEKYSVTFSKSTEVFF